ncbi:hypothetical protein, partial [Stenotrophomonas maltophilia]|uniref:hypothetical protein n=1 Tax=Stenotrophomonas maltophilia TaxID=40324 RepID=UPI001A7E1BB3
QAKQNTRIRGGCDPTEWQSRPLAGCSVHCGLPASGRHYPACTRRQRAKQNTRIRGGCDPTEW